MIILLVGRGRAQIAHFISLSFLQNPQVSSYLLFFSSSPHHQGIPPFLYSSDFPQKQHFSKADTLKPLPYRQDHEHSSPDLCSILRHLLLHFLFLLVILSELSVSHPLSFVLLSLSLLRFYSPIFYIYRLGAVMDSKISVGIYFFISILKGNLKVVEFSLS